MTKLLLISAAVCLNVSGCTFSQSGQVHVPDRDSDLGWLAFQPGRRVGWHGNIPIHSAIFMPTLLAAAVSV